MTNEPVPPPNRDWLYLSETGKPAPPRCSSCWRERTTLDTLDYHPIQVVLGQTLGWYSGDDGELCPQCMAKTLNRQL